ncbi:MAG: HD domain-containing protein, partial [Candidatus Eiseniibacteriota bacterium]
MGRARKNSNLGFVLFYAGTVGLGVFLLAALTPTAVVPSWTAVAIWGLLVFVCAVLPVPLPTGAVMMVSSAMDYAGIIIFGPIITAWIEVLTTGVAQIFVHRRPLYKAGFNMSLHAITILSAGHVYLLLGGKIGELTLPGSLLGLLACGLTYFAINTSAISVVIALKERANAWRVWQVNYLWTIFHLLAFLPLGALVALVYFTAGLWGVSFFFVPLLLARHSFKLYTDMRRDHFDFVRALTGVIDEIDPYTRQHSLRVAEYAVRLARGLNLSESEVQTIEYAALVHDLGKIDLVYRDILGKPGALSTEERKTLTKHPGVGADIVTKVRSLKKASEMVRSHHERPDGKGYPFGLVDEDVPVGAR